MITRDDIQKMADIIAERFRPEKIILFGSHARGEATEDSDVDLLVVDSGQGRRRERAAAMRAAVWQVPGAKDIFVCDQRQLDAQCGSPSSVLHDVALEGKVLFSRA